ncbi:AAA family ATPase [Pendulispora albinea]|uniref:ATP-binding protein n=1 Tax=Pendulispora albinea TaxID=2741071 RepID=A0ABZ2MBZ1_9BACT
MIPPMQRLPEARRYIDQGDYLVLHAPRQTGKTTALHAFARALTAEGVYAALHFSCEAAEPAQDDFAEAQRAILSSISLSANIHLPTELRPPASWPAEPDSTLLSLGLTAWAQQCPRPLVLFFDEIDALRGESLRSVLRQLRRGFFDRPHQAPHAVILCGLRDVRDYKAASGGDPSRLGTSSPFNIKLASLRLRDFTEGEVRALYQQHIDRTGQPIDEDALSRIWELTRGQPWLTNAIGREILEEMSILPPARITREHIEQAKERLILARATHLDSLVARLHEDRVRRILEPVLAGTTSTALDTYEDDFQYVVDLGLVAAGPTVEIANPIYREVITRILASGVERQIPLETKSFVRPDGHLDMEKMLTEFTRFWVEHGEILASAMSYHEVAPQLVLMAFLQRIVNGGGYIEREVGVGRGRIDLLVRWPLPDKTGWQREAIELKVWREGRPDPLPEGLAQLEGYLTRLGLHHGFLAIFDRRRQAPPLTERTRVEKTRTAGGRETVLLRA